MTEWTDLIMGVKEHYCLAEGNGIVYAGNISILGRHCPEKDFCL